MRDRESRARVPGGRVRFGLPFAERRRRADDMLRRRDRGQALVEFALFLPVMLVLLLLAVDFGRLFFSYIAVNNAAREATNYAAAHAADDPFDKAAFDAAAIAAALRETNAQSQGDAGQVTVTAPVCFDPVGGTTMSCDTAANFAGGIGNQVRVSATQPFDFITPLVGELFGGQLDLYAEATGSVLNPPDAAILAEPTGSPSPSPSPSPTDSPTASPSCIVPNFKNTFFNNPDALNTWHNVAGFTGTLTDASNGNKIKSQTIAKNTEVDCTSDMTVSD